jgi:hypothetical protein
MPVEGDSGGTAQSDLYEQANDIWKRARTNAFAHRIAAENAERKTIWLTAAIALCTVLPIVAVGLTLENVTDGGSVVHPATVFGLTVRHLSITAIISNGIALFLSVMAKELKYAESAAQHRTLMAGYQVLAQKARRKEFEGLPNDEVRHLLRNLQEMFETYKSSPYEPGDKDFEKAQERMTKISPSPFTNSSSKPKTSE